MYIYINIYIGREGARERDRENLTLPPGVTKRERKRERSKARARERADLAVSIFEDLIASDNIRKAQPHTPTRRQTKETLGWRFTEVLSVNVDLTRKRNCSSAQLGSFRVYLVVRVVVRVKWNLIR